MKLTRAQRRAIRKSREAAYQDRFRVKHLAGSLDTLGPFEALPFWLEHDFHWDGPVGGYVPLLVAIRRDPPSYTDGHGHPVPPWISNSEMGGGECPPLVGLHADYFAHLEALAFLAEHEFDALPPCLREAIEGLQRWKARKVLERAEKL